MRSAILNIKGRFLSGLLLFCCFSTAQAHELSLLIGNERWLYREYSEFNSELNREQGWLSGFEAALLLDLGQQHKIHLLYAFQDDSLDYEGATQVGDPLTTTTDEITYTNIATWRYYFDNVYLGLGGYYQGWDRKIRAAGDVKHLYEFYRWFGPVLELGWFKQYQQVKLELEGTVASLNGDLVVDLTHVGLNKPKLYLRNGYEVGAVLTLSFQLSEQWALELKHNQGYRYFPKTDFVTDRRGSKQLTISEPESKNYFQGYWLGLSYQF